MSAKESTGGSRIAIKFGAPSSTSTRTPFRAAPPSSLGKRSRRHALNDDSASEGEEDATDGKHERVTTFGDDGADTERPPRDRTQDKKVHRTIDARPNRDWRAEARTRRKGRHPQAKSERAKEAESESDKEVIKWGLTVKKTKAGGGQGEPNDQPGTASKQPEPPATSPAQAEGDAPGDAAPPDADKEALDALLGKPSSTARQSKTIISREPDRVTEDDAFRRDFRDAPGESTLDDYEAMPVEDFGQALLRGMGWNGEHRGPKSRETTKRANQQGLGAARLKGEEDLGAWNQKGGGGKSRPRVHEYRSEERKQKEGKSEKYRDSYKQERERERGSDQNGHRHRDRHHR